MPELLRGGEVVAPLEVAASLRDRIRGLLGRDGLQGALLLSPASSVHTLGLRFAIDVAYCDARMRVLDTVTMRPNRIGRPRLRCRHVVEAEAGRFARWGLRRATSWRCAARLASPCCRNFEANSLAEAYAMMPR